MPYIISYNPIFTNYRIYKRNIQSKLQVFKSESLAKKEMGYLRTWIYRKPRVKYITFKKAFDLTKKYG